MQRVPTIRGGVARDISYAHSAQSKGGRAVIRVLENATGRLGLIRKAKGYELELADGANFWALMADRYGLNLSVQGGDLSHIPATGPLIVVANHPYGILDGLMMGRILSERRGDDFKILANHVFRKSAELQKVVLPVSFDETKAAAKLNLKTRSEALTHLKNGGAIGVFPGGTVSTAAKPFSRPLDPTWRNFTAKMISRSDARVVPLFFDGTNSRLFQIASHLNVNLRMGMMIREFRSRLNSDVDVTVGAPIERAVLDTLRQDPNAMMDFLRKATYDLSPRLIDSGQYGHEFDDKYKARHGSGNL